MRAKAVPPVPPNRLFGDPVGEAKKQTRGANPSRSPEREKQRLGAPPGNRLGFSGIVPKLYFKVGIFNPSRETD